MHDGQWHLQDFYGRGGHSETGTYHIGGVQALARYDGILAPALPKPLTVLAVAAGVGLLGRYARKRTLACGGARKRSHLAICPGIQLEIGPRDGRPGIPG